MFPSILMVVIIVIIIIMYGCDNDNVVVVGEGCGLLCAIYVQGHRAHNLLTVVLLVLCGVWGFLPLFSSFAGLFSNNEMSW